MSRIRCPLFDAVEMSRNRVAIDAAGQGVLFYHVEERVRAVGLGLAEAGLQVGQVLGLCLPRCWEAWVIQLAAWRAGYVVCPLDPAWPLELLRYGLEQAQCDCLIAPMDAGQTHSGQPLLDSRALVAAPAPPALEEAPYWDLNQPALRVIIGRHPAPVMQYSLQSLYYAARGANAIQRIHASDRWMTTAGPTDPAGILTMMRTLLTGGILVLPDPAMALTEQVVDRELTLLDLAPHELDFLLEEAQPSEWPQLRAIMVSAPRVSTDTLARVHELKWPLWGTLAYAETLGPIGIGPLYLDPPPPMHLFHGMESRVGDDDRIQFKGPSLADVQLLDGTATPLSVDAGGWWSSNITDFEFSARP